MSQRHPFSTVSCFRRFASRDKISHCFDRFICQRLYYDAEIAWMISRNLFGFIVCYDIDNVHIEVISIQKLFNIDCRKLVEISVLTLKK
jgi:hypothetical protein